MDTIDASPDRLGHVAAVLCTRHRPLGAREALASILATRPAPALVVVVDQADPDSADPLREFDGRPDVVRIQHRGTGLSRARNVAAAAAEARGATILAYTDDDCTVEIGWLAGLAAAFDTAGDVALVFGTTQAADHDQERGVIPAYVATRAAVHRGLSSKPRTEGMGACMAIRVDAWRAIGGFDDRLGPGTSLAAADENDLSIRLLHAGFAVAETPDAVVLHRGYRTGDDAAALLAGYMRGSGAAVAKMVRLGGARTMQPLVAIATRWLLGRSSVRMGNLPPRRVRLRNFLEGARLGWTWNLDPRTGRFLPFAGPDDLAPPGPAAPGITPVGTIAAP